MKELKIELLKDLPGVKAGSNNTNYDGFHYFFGNQNIYSEKEIHDNPDFFKVIEEPDILLVTEDGVEIKFRDNLWAFDTSKNTVHKYQYNWFWIDLDNSKERFDTFKKLGIKFFYSEQSAKDFIERLKPKTVYTTEDGYEVKEGEAVLLHGVGLLTTELYKKIKLPYECFNNFWTVNFKWFFDKDKAREYLAKNYNFLSVDELHDLYKPFRNMDDFLEDIENLAEQKAKQIIP